MFLVGTTNHPDHIVPRVLRGGRFSEKIEIGMPGRKSRERLLSKYLDGVALGADAGIPALSDRLQDLSPADLEAISNTARRFAFNRAPDGSEPPPLVWADFEKAVQLSPNSASALSGLAWFRATCPNASLRNGKEAIRMSMRACELMGWKEPGAISTLAAAYAEAGDFNQAVKYQIQASNMASEYGPVLKEEH